jgi:hypothetical protein
LTEPVTFKAVLQRGNKVQVPRLLRWQHRMEPDQLLRVEVRSPDFFGDESFLGRMRKDGRLTIPKLTLKLLRRDEGSLEGFALEVTLEPAEKHDEKPG